MTLVLLFDSPSFLFRIAVRCGRRQGLNEMSTLDEILSIQKTTTRHNDYDYGEQRFLSLRMMFSVTGTACDYFLSMYSTYQVMHPSYKVPPPFDSAFLQIFELGWNALSV